MRHWVDTRYENTNTSGQRDFCILQTINDAYKSNFLNINVDKDKQKELINHILDKIKEYAKENGLEDKANRYLGGIRTDFECGHKDDAYKRFRQMLAEVFDIPQKDAPYGNINTWG